MQEYGGSARYRTGAFVTEWMRREQLNMVQPTSMADQTERSTTNFPSRRSVMLFLCGLRSRDTDQGGPIMTQRVNYDEHHVYAPSENDKHMSELVFQEDVYVVN